MWDLFKATVGYTWQFMVLKWCEGLNLLSPSQEAGDTPKQGVGVQDGHGPSHLFKASTMEPQIYSH